jgi:hypothetical protein
MAPARRSIARVFGGLKDHLVDRRVDRPVDAQKVSSRSIAFNVR